MTTGPSIGPGIVLQILMRWPIMIIVIAVGSVGTLAWDEGKGFVLEAMSRNTLLNPPNEELPTSRVASSLEGLINLGGGLCLKVETEIEPPTHEPNFRKRAGLDRELDERHKENI